MGDGEGNRLNVHGSVAFPHSLGLYYTALSQYLGFWKFGDEYKVMGLAAYGEPNYVEELRRVVTPGNGKGFSLGLEYFCHHKTGPEMTWQENGKTPVLGQLFSPYLEERLGKTRPAMSRSARSIRILPPPCKWCWKKRIFAC